MNATTSFMANREQPECAITGDPHLDQGIVWVVSAVDRRSWSVLRGRFSARATTNRENARGSCRSRGRQERAHRSLENRKTGFPQLPPALSSFTRKPEKCYPCSRLTLLPMFPVAPGALLKADLIPASLTIGVGLTDSLHLDNDLPFGPAHLEIRKRLLRLIERKYLVDHRPNVPHLEKLADLCELATVWIHEQE
jgi:hypothetical protein